MIWAYILTQHVRTKTIIKHLADKKVWCILLIRLHSIQIHQPFGKPSSKHNVLMQTNILFCIIMVSSEITWAAKTYIDYWSCKSIPVNIFSILFLVLDKNKEEHWGKCRKNNDNIPCTTKIITIHERKKEHKAKHSSGRILLLSRCCS